MLLKLPFCKQYCLCVITTTLCLVVALHPEPFFLRQGLHRRVLKPRQLFVSNFLFLKLEKINGDVIVVRAGFMVRWLIVVGGIVGRARFMGSWPKNWRRWRVHHKHCSKEEEGLWGYFCPFPCHFANLMTWQ